MELTHIASRAARLSAILKEDMGVSTALMNKLKWQEKLFVNGISQRTNFQVSPGDVITLPLEEAEPDYPAEDGQLSILYEDDHLLAVDKPAGMLIHPSRSRNTGTLANLVLGYYQKTGKPCAFHPMTRLDRDTFGIVLLAKSAHVHSLLQQTAVEKIYHALTFGGPTEDRGIIDLPIARKPLPSLLREIRPDGKPSVTEFTVLARSENVTKLALQPITGRTHQLRLHCAHMGYPILGDPQYASPESLEYSGKLGLSSQLLCAKSLRFSHPLTGEQLHLQSKMDAEADDGELKVDN